jgi:lysozyme
MIAGIDLSNNNPVADFAAIRSAGYEFCIHKASEGVGFRDRFLAPRWREMKANNVSRGCYHFARPSQTTAAAEADYFLAIVQPLLEPGDSVWLDQEDERFHGNASPWSLEWLERVEDELGFRPGIYTYPAYITERSLNDPRLAKYPLWWASYAEPMRPTPRPWTSTAVWQYTSDGLVPGTTGRIDLNWLLADDIQAFLDLGMPGLEAAEADLQWRGTVRGRGHWGGDPLPVERRGDRLYRSGDGMDLTGMSLDDWETTTAAAGQLTID